MIDPADQFESTSPPAETHRVACPVFAPGRLYRQLRLDSGLRWSMFLTLGVFFALSSLWTGEGSEYAVVILIVIVAVLWITVGSATARVTQQLGRITELMSADPEQAEAVLAGAVRRRLLQRPVRLLLYHRLAMLRHRQRRLSESAAICRALLGLPRSLPREVRAHLLMLLAEAQLEYQDLAGAHSSLLGLHNMSLNLLEELQRLTLQLRYEVSAGHDQPALSGVGKKLRLAELLPPVQCGMVHLLLATAAKRAHRAGLADWLERRAALLCSPDQIEQFAGHGWMTVQLPTL